MGFVNALLRDRGWVWLWGYTHNCFSWVAFNISLLCTQAFGVQWVLFTHSLFDPVAIGSYCSHCSACRPNAVVYLIFPILPSFSFLSLSLSLSLFSILSPSHLDPFDWFHHIKSKEHRSTSLKHRKTLTLINPQESKQQAYHWTRLLHHPLKFNSIFLCRLTRVCIPSSIVHVWGSVPPINIRVRTPTNFLLVVFLLAWPMIILAQMFTPQFSR